MLRFFKPKNDRPSLLSPLWDRVGMALTRQQRICADYLASKAEKLSHRSKLVFLLLFCLLFSGGGIYFIVSAFQRETGKINIERLSFPAHVIPRDRLIDRSSPAILSIRELQHIHWLRSYLDSLQQRGSPVYDSLILANPGLLDNLSIVEKWLNEQYKTK